MPQGQAIKLVTYLYKDFAATCTHCGKWFAAVLAYYYMKPAGVDLRPPESLSLRA